MSEIPVEVRRAAVEEIHREIRDTLDRLGESVRLGHEGGMEWSGTPSRLQLDAPAFIDHLRRLSWLLALSPAERAFVDAAASAVREGNAAEAYETLLVFADWLEEAGKESSPIRRLVPQSGDVVGMTYPAIRPPALSADAAKQAARSVLEGIQARLAGVGRDVSIVAMPDNWKLQVMREEEMYSQGWARRSKLEKAEKECKALTDVRDHLRAQVGELSQEAHQRRRERTRDEGEVAAMREEIEELKRENARLLRERRERPA